MLTALALVAQLAALPLPREEVVVSSPEMIRPTGRSRSARLLLQGSAGLATGLVLGLIAMETEVVGLIPCPVGELPRCPEARSEGLRAGFGLGAGIGVLGSGELLSADGSYIGMGLGMGLGATTALLISLFSPEMGTVASLTLPLAGALTGYELGGADVNNRYAIRPSFSVGAGKVNVGVAGEF